MLSTLNTNNAVASENHQSNAPVNQSQQLSKKKQKTIKNFSIEIEDNRTTFLPGQRIDGHIALEVTQPIDVKLLRIRFSGTVASHLHRNDTPLINPNSDISLFKDLQNCIGSTSLSEAPVQIEGESVYPFSFRLPPLNLPTSFRGRHGRVFYEIAAVLVRPGHVNKTVSLDLTVPSTVDSLDPIYNDPVEKACTVPVGQWIFDSGHMELKGSIPRSAYAPEDIVPLKVEILNQSDSVLKLLNISLKQKTIYRTSDEILGPQTEKIHKLNFTEIYPSNLKRITRHIQFPIPTTAIISPSIKTSILEVNHFLVVKVHVKPSFIKKKNPESSKDSHIFKQILNIFSKKKPIPTAKQEQPEFKMQVYHPDEEDRLNDRSSFPNNVSRSSSSIEDPSNISSVHENSPPRLLSVLTAEPTQDSDTDSISQRNHHQSMIITPSSPLTQQLNRSSSTPNFALNTASPSVRPLKLKNQSWLRLGWKKKTVKIEIPIVIAGFPYVLLDVANGGRRSIDTLPIYLLGNARSDDVEGNGDENSSRDSEVDGERR